MKNSADLGGCYPPRPSASVGNTLLDLQNSSYPTQPHSIIAKYCGRTLRMHASFIAHWKVKYLHRRDRFQSNCHLHHKSMDCLLPWHNRWHISRCILLGRALVLMCHKVGLSHQRPVVVEPDTCELREGYIVKSQTRYLLAKLQNTPPLICISLNKNSIFNNFSMSARWIWDDG